MSFLLGVNNVFDYLVTQGICGQGKQYINQIEPKSSKNFNLLVSLTDGRQLLVKQEPHDTNGKTYEHFLKEWCLHELLEKYPELSYIRSRLVEAIHYDQSRAILVFNYLSSYCNVMEFYAQGEAFPIEIASLIGTTLATVHSSTIDCHKYKDFLVGKENNFDKTPNFFSGLEPIDPQIFGIFTADALKFFELFQRFESLRHAIAELSTYFECCCLTHNDLKLENILVHTKWQQTLAQADPLANSIVRLIDWEHANWGDPAFDLGKMLSSYLLIWLNSLEVTTDIDVETALRLAIIPLDQLQPSLVALTKAYLAHFPKILERRPNFWLRVVQFTGLALLRNMRLKLQSQRPFGYPEPFGNQGICKLQVAKTLLCSPERSIPVIFGTSASELTSFSRLSA